MMLTAFV